MPPAALHLTGALPLRLAGILRLQHPLQVRGPLHAHLPAVLAQDTLGLAVGLDRAGKCLDFPGNSRGLFLID